LSLYKDAIKSYEFEAHYMNDKPLEQGFDRRLMSDKTSSLYDAVRSLFLELRLSQASRYIAAWEKAYIIGGWCADDDRQRYESLVAVGQAFIQECKRIAAECCDDDVHPQGERPKGGGGIDHQNKVQQNKTQTEIQKSARGKGRPKETLQDKVVGGDTKLIEKLHSLIDGKRGKDVALYIVACMKLGKLTRPTYTQIVNEFGDIGSKAGYNRYLDEKKFTTIELEGAMNQIKGL